MRSRKPPCGALAMSRRPPTSERCSSANTHASRTMERVAQRRRSAPSPISRRVPRTPSTRRSESVPTRSPPARDVLRPDHIQLWFRRHVHVRDHAQGRHHAGTYSFCNIVTGESSRVTVQAARPADVEAAAVHCRTVRASARRARAARRSPVASPVPRPAAFSDIMRAT